MSKEEVKVEEVMVEMPGAVVAQMVGDDVRVIVRVVNPATGAQLREVELATVGALEAATGGDSDPHDGPVNDVDGEPTQDEE